MAFSVYSLSDVKVTIEHGGESFDLSTEKGSGRIGISYSGDMSSHTTTATGYVVINKLVAKNGSISLEIPNNSDADAWLRNWITILKNSATNTFADTTITLTDKAALTKKNLDDKTDPSGRTLTFTGVTPQKEPNEAYDQTAGNRQYNLLFAEMTVV